MNERIKELARQAGFTDFPNDVNGVWITDGYWEEELERFAELVRQDEREQAEKQEKLCKYCGGIGRVVCDGRCMPEQEPKAWIYEGNLHIFDPTDWAIEPESVQPLYTAPNMSTKPENIDTSEKRVHETDKSIHDDDDIQEYKRPWVGLSDVEIATYSKVVNGVRLAREIEGLLRERNT